MRKIIAVFIVAALFIVGCTSTPDQIEQKQVQQQQTALNQAQPPPFFEWSLERHLMIELYKTRNKATSTFSYVVNQYTGKVLWECPSIGFPIPADTQLTNPIQEAGVRGATIEQAEPNGMFTSKSTRGTFIMCVEKDGTVAPRYDERDISVFPYPMAEVDGKLVRKDESSESSIRINIQRPAQQMPRTDSTKKH